MTDIVERLRNTHPNFDEKPMCEEAANEIERLKNQIFHIIEHNNPQIEQANSYFKLLEEELARCNKIIDDYEEEHSRLRAALRYYASDAAWTIAQVEGAYGDYGQIARAALEGEKKNDVAT